MQLTQVPLLSLFLKIFSIFSLDFAQLYFVKKKKNIDKIIRNYNNNRSMYLRRLFSSWNCSKTHNRYYNNNIMYCSATDRG